MADQPDNTDQTQRPRNEIDLTPEDEDALDRAWDSITDAEIEASIRWLDELKRQPQRQRQHSSDTATEE